LRRVFLRLRKPVGESETRDQGETASQRPQASPHDNKPAEAVPVVLQPPHVTSEPAIPIPAADPNGDQLAADQVLRTAFPWLTLLSSTAAVVGLEVLGEGLVALFRSDPASPSTTAALERTQAIADATNEEVTDLMVTWTTYRWALATCRGRCRTGGLQMRSSTEISACYGGGRRRRGG